MPVYINCKIPEPLKKRFLCLLPLEKGRNQTMVIEQTVREWCDKEEKKKRKNNQ